MISQYQIESIKKMRTEAVSIKKIAVALSLSPATVLKYCKDIVLTQEQKYKLQDDRITESVNSHKKHKDSNESYNWINQTSKVSKDYNPKQIGDNSCINIMACFSNDNRVILMPFGDNQRYDLVVEENGRFITVQCKTGRITKTGFLFQTSSSNWNSGKISKYTNEVDIFAVYLRENKKVYIFNVNNCLSTTCSVRFKESVYRNNKIPKIAINHEYQNGKSLLEYF